MNSTFRFNILDPDTATDQLDHLVACYLRPDWEHAPLFDVLVRPLP